ncbi:CRAL-TRIO domain-containing protein [Sporodiniella umbellata]|nr:CRAL-TRIO domain-containing protein [Sporodiniella umbellata]
MTLSGFQVKISGKSSSAVSLNSKADSVVNLGPITQEPILTPPDTFIPVLNPPLDEEQQKKAQLLMEFAESIILPSENEYHPNERAFLSEGTMHRYLRARKWDLEAAKVMLENSIKWRREFKPDQLDPDSVRAEAETGKMYYNGYDKTGKPLWIMKPRNENSKDSDSQIKHVVFNLERGIRLMPPNVEKVSIVVDFKGSSVASTPSASTCKKFIDIFGNQYPERLGVAFFVNFGCSLYGSSDKKQDQIY